MSEQKRAGRRALFSGDEYRQAFLAGDYSSCRSLLENIAGSAQAILLEATVDFREQRYVEMIEPLASLKTTDERVAIERDVLLGAAYGHTKDYSTARMRLDRVLEKSGKGDPLHYDALFYKGLVAWMEHEHRESEALATAMLADASPNNLARAYTLLSWVAVRRRDVAQQVSRLMNVLEILEQAPEPDEYYRAKALVTLSLLCRELPLPEIDERIRRTYDAMRWSTGLRWPQFQATRQLGWVEALQGNELAAFRSFRAATAIAPSKHWRVLCLTDRAYLAHHTGEHSYAEDLMHEAHELAQNLSWHETAHEERSALFVLAELFSSTVPALSQQYLAQFRSLQTSVLPGISYSDDPRTRAFAGYSSGKALLELGEKEEATAALLEAREIFEAFGYGWRLALCALALYKATDEEKWLVEARRQITPWPRSWISREVAAAAEAASDKHLPKAQRRVLELLVEGKSNAEIARALGRSPYTVRNHIAQLFKTYSVTNRTQLAALFKPH